jgi:hypothetical protein
MPINYSVSAVRNNQQRHIANLNERCIRMAIEAEHKFRNRPFIERFAAMVVAGFYDFVPDQVIIEENEVD